MSCCHAQCASRLRSNPRFSQMPDPETLLDVQKCSSSKACSFWILGESLNIFDMGSGWIRMDQEYHAIERTIIWRTWRTCWIMQWRIVNNTYMDKPPIYRIPLQSITYTQYTLWIFMIYTMHTLHISHVFTCHVYLFQFTTWNCRWKFHVYFPSVWLKSIWGWLSLLHQPLGEGRSQFRSAICFQRVLST